MTRGLVSFNFNNKPYFTVEHYHDGSPDSLGSRIAGFLAEYEIVNGISDDELNQANGLEDLVLLYVLEFKDGPGDVYFVQDWDSADYTYELYFSMNEEHLASLDRICVMNDKDKILFDGELNNYEVFTSEFTED